jgi:hypothetical protein
MMFYQFSVVTNAEIPAASVLFSVAPGAFMSNVSHEFTNSETYTKYNVIFQGSDVINIEDIPSGTTITNSGVLFLS